MDSSAETKILTMLDVLALEVAGTRRDVGGLTRDVGELRCDLADFRSETSANFNRLERRLDNHESRIEKLERPATST